MSFKDRYMLVYHKRPVLCGFASGAIVLEAAYLAGELIQSGWSYVLAVPLVVWFVFAMVNAK